MAALCLLSGGLDSSTALALAQEQGIVALALTVDYGQRAAKSEQRAAARIAARFDVPHELLRLDLYRGRGGALLDRAQDVPKPAASDIEAGDPSLRQTADAVWVPNRNGVLLQLAAARAELEGMDVVLAGFNREEAVTFPDNSPEFLSETNRALRYSTRGAVRVESPTIEMDKATILGHAVRLQIPLEALWPCYLGGKSPCGTCESCQRLARACVQNGIRLPWDSPAGGGQPR